MHGEENWIDFESEICDVVKSIDINMGKSSVYGIVEKLENKFMNERFIENKNKPSYEDILQSPPRKEKITYKKLIYNLLDDLNNLIRALEIYLTYYIDSIDEDNLLDDIKEIAPSINKVINFNYTGTYYKYWRKEEAPEVDFLHGRAYMDNKENNMVLGIDEYLKTEEEQRTKIELIEFKKFYQRIHKQTGCKYREWIDEIEDSNKNKSYIEEQINQFKAVQTERDGVINEVLGNLEAKLCSINSENNIYIFGHSLDITDGDILRDLILNENVYTTIYYLNREQNSQQIANLVKIIGENELIKRTGGKNRTIEFKEQTN